MNNQCRCRYEIPKAPDPDFNVEPPELDWPSPRDPTGGSDFAVGTTEFLVCVACFAFGLAIGALV